MGMNDKDLLMELIRDIANELDVDTLCHKILLNVSTLTRWGYRVRCVPLCPTLPYNFMCILLYTQTHIAEFFREILSKI